MLSNIGQYLMTILVAIDVLGNTLCGGSRWHTISARTGYFAFSKCATTHPGRWKALACIIDASFLPWQGPNHCECASKGEAKVVQSPKFKWGSEAATWVVSIPILCCCPIIFAIGCLASVLRLNTNNQPTGR